MQIKSSDFSMEIQEVLHWTLSYKVINFRYDKHPALQLTLTFLPQVCFDGKSAQQFE